MPQIRMQIPLSPIIWFLALEIIIIPSSRPSQMVRSKLLPLSTMRIMLRATPLEYRLRTSSIATVEQVFTLFLTDVYEPSNPNHTVDLNSSVNLEMIWVDPGTFIMGSPISEPYRDANETEHNVTLTRGFYLGKYEVTQAQYTAVMTGNNDGLNPKPSWWPNHPNRPVETVSWIDLQRFLERLNQQEADNIPVGWEYTLPTEAQWEYACRAGTTTVYSWGDDINSSRANYNGSIPQTTNVGQYSANNWGFFDMHGNVWEWIADWHEVSYPNTNPVTDPVGPFSGAERVLRGGSRLDNGAGLRSAKRGSHNPGGRLSNLGFRLAYKQIPNQPPTDLNTTAPLIVAENIPIGSVIGEFQCHRYGCKYHPHLSFRIRRQ